MKYEIETTKNGYILIEQSEDSVHKYIYENLKDVLHHLVSEEQPGSRYDDERLYVITAPGDKNVNFKEYHMKVIWGDDD